MKILKIKIDSAYLNEFENVKRDLIQCMTVLTIGPGSKPMKFFHDAFATIDKASKDFKKFIEPKLNTMNWDRQKGRAIYDLCFAAYDSLKDYTTLSPVWKEYGGLKEDKKPYMHAFGNLFKSFSSLMSALKLLDK